MTSVTDEFGDTLIKSFVLHLLDPTLANFPQQQVPGGGTPILDLSLMLVVTFLGVEIVDPVTFRVSGRKN